MAQARLEKRAKHLHFLSAELSFFELFNVNTATSSIESRRQLAKVLAELLPQWNPGNFLINPYFVLHEDICTNEASTAWETGLPCISTFATRHSFLLPELLGLTPADMEWLRLEPQAWKEEPAFCKLFKYVHSLEVTNDVAERDVNLLSLKKNKVGTLSRLQDTMMMTADTRRLQGPKYRRSSLNKSIIQKSVDSIMRVSESGQAWLESDLTDSESDSDS
jgi:hypothetical protein